MENDDIVAGIVKFPEQGTHMWLGVLWFMTICASDQNAMKRLMEAHPGTLDFIKYGEDGHILADVLECERYFKDHLNEIFEQQQKAVKTHVRGPVPYCSLCDALAADSFLDYCPRCGAKMNEESTNA